ncbi:hypothetical protein C8Q74DRAFT_1308240 [Fomes fomentarius]|nr:hypothetical protein C8Q74DRAFT_1308240 [Fomes fomentarius]
MSIYLLLLRLFLSSLCVLHSCGISYSFSSDHCERSDVALEMIYSSIASLHFVWIAHVAAMLHRIICSRTRNSEDLPPDYLNQRYTRTHGRHQHQHQH